MQKTIDLEFDYEKLKEEIKALEGMRKEDLSVLLPFSPLKLSTLYEKLLEGQSLLEKITSIYIRIHLLRGEAESRLNEKEGQYEKEYNALLANDEGVRSQKSAELRIAFVENQLKELKDTVVEAKKEVILLKSLQEAISLKYRETLSLLEVLSRLITVIEDITLIRETKDVSLRDVVKVKI